jgi:hypothetical protein
MSGGKLRVISTKQCKRARALLKWNPNDLASRTRIPLRHLEKFERNQVRLTKPENDEVVKVFERHNVEFMPDGNVLLHGSALEGDYHNTSKEFKHFDLDKSEDTAVEDLEAQLKEQESKAKAEEEKQLKREREEAERHKKQGN